MLTINLSSGSKQLNIPVIKERHPQTVSKIKYGRFDESKRVILLLLSDILLSLANLPSKTNINTDIIGVIIMEEIDIKALISM